MERGNAFLYLRGHCNALVALQNAPFDILGGFIGILCKPVETLCQPSCHSNGTVSI